MNRNDYFHYEIENIEGYWVVIFSWGVVPYSYDTFCELAIKYDGKLNKFNACFKTKEKMQNFIDNILIPLIIMKKLSGEL